MPAELNLWQGIVIAEALNDPTLINTLRVNRAEISSTEQPLDDGTTGRWHLYWVQVAPEQINALQAATKREWYAHFWSEQHLIVCFDDARFEMDRHDRSTWQPAIEHGLAQGLRREWLDFPTEDPT